MSDNYWEMVYQNKEADQVSWYQSNASTSLRLIQSSGIAKDASLIDVGSGASTLIDQLIEAGFNHLTIVDLSETALHKTQQRLANKQLDASQVQWLITDICQAALPAQTYALWHDRAVFHFMITLEQQQQYLFTLRQSMQDQSFVIMATFAEDGPMQCSGLPVQRYSPETLATVLGNDFHLLHHEYECHVTPWQAEQHFLYTVWRFNTR